MSTIPTNTIGKDVQCAGCWSVSDPNPYYGKAGATGQICQFLYEGKFAYICPEHCVCEAKHCGCASKGLTCPIGEPGHCVSCVFARIFGPPIDP